LLQRLKLEHRVNALDGEAAIAQRLLHFLNGLVDVDFPLGLLEA
jgi:hypothetical protein